MPNTTLPPRFPKAMLAVGGEGFGIRAAGGPQNIESMFNEMNSLLRDGFTQRDQQLQNLETALNAVQSQVNAGGVSVVGSILPVEPDYMPDQSPGSRCASWR
ncbi:hypothetical protein QP185_10615 [Sphingomonas aerolata]|uniref:hypothetical protein n=1 Tax=Sphingomonas aerolata TaxID=185951 RepID=UPI002FE2F9CB